MIPIKRILHWEEDCAALIHSDLKNNIKKQEYII